MRVKTLQLVLSFATNMDALAVEKWAKQQEIEGRIIPLPPAIHAGCGLAYKTSPSNRTILEENLRDEGLSVEGFHELMLY